MTPQLFSARYYDGAILFLLQPFGPAMKHLRPLKTVPFFDDRIMRTKMHVLMLPRIALAWRPKRCPETLTCSLYTNERLAALPSNVIGQLKHEMFRIYRSRL